MASDYGPLRDVFFVEHEPHNHHVFRVPAFFLCHNNRGGISSRYLEEKDGRNRKGRDHEQPMKFRMRLELKPPDVCLFLSGK